MAEDERHPQKTKRRSRPPTTSSLAQQREPQRDQSYVKNVAPKTEGQARLMEAIDRSNLVLALGPAGTGKTYLAIAKAVEALRAGKVGRIVLCRPAVDAGENIGFLPGDMEEKLAPYLRPLYDALQDRMSAKQVKAMIAEGQIEIASVGFMRGRTLNNAFIVVDEAQNCTYVQLKMILTRLGWNSKMIVTGDPAQSDLLPELSGLAAGRRPHRKHERRHRRRPPPTGRRRPPPARREDAGRSVGHCNSRLTQARPALRGRAFARRPLTTPASQP